jgi:hypothetical protein
MVSPCPGVFFFFGGKQSRDHTCVQRPLAVFKGKTTKNRFGIPISYLKHPSFQNLLSQLYYRPHVNRVVNYLCKAN